MSDIRYALVIRGAKALATPLGLLPDLQDAISVVNVIEFRDHSSIRVVTASTGGAPDGWAWMNIANLQSNVAREVSNDLANEIGDAVLCAI